jgi:hypothetical protein
MIDCVESAVVAFSRIRIRGVVPTDCSGRSLESKILFEYLAVALLVPA